MDFGWTNNSIIRYFSQFENYYFVMKKTLCDYAQCINNKYSFRFVLIVCFNGISSNFSEECLRVTDLTQRQREKERERRRKRKEASPQRENTRDRKREGKLVEITLNLHWIEYFFPFACRELIKGRRE